MHDRYEKPEWLEQDEEDDSLWEEAEWDYPYHFFSAETAAEEECMDALFIAILFQDGCFSEDHYSEDHYSEGSYCNDYYDPREWY